MTRLIAFLVAVVALALGFSWLADHPGEVRTVWLGQEITFSVMVGAIGLALLVFAIILIWSVLSGLVRAPPSTALRC
ncbi:hypothetical protein KC218_27345, partial [Mycobacterium tuberculosis]|nr:hypothetical protein [Mycobacterium tuberculosis]